MGDMADAFLSEVMEFEELRIDYKHGRMGDVEAYELGIIDEYGAFIESRRCARTKTCRCCGEAGLVWKQHNGSWRLFNGDTLHQCPANPLSE